MTNDISHEQAKAIREEIQKAAEAILAKYGLTIQKAGCTYSPNSINVRIEAASDAKTGSDFNRYRGLYGLNADALGKRFVVQGSTYVLTGVSPNRPRFPLNGTEVHAGNAFKFAASPSTIAQLNAGNVPEPAPFVPPVRTPSAPSAPTSSGRAKLLAELQTLGYTGPTSYTNSRLQEIVDEQKAKVA